MNAVTRPTTGSTPLRALARGCPGEYRWLIRGSLWLWLAALVSWGVTVWLGRMAGTEAWRVRQAGLFQPLITGNLALAGLLIWLDLGASALQARSIGPRLGLWFAGVAAGVVATSGGLLALGLWRSDLAIVTLFLVPSALIVIVPFLHAAAALLRSRAHRGALLASYLLASAAIMQFALHGGRGRTADPFERVLVASSALAGLAVLTWLAIWGTPRREGGPHE